MPTIDPNYTRILSPESAVDAMLSAARHQLSSPIGRLRSQELAGMLDQEGGNAFTQRFKAMPPLQALTELVHATAFESIDCDHYRPNPLEMELISSARGEALMTLANENQLSRMDQYDAQLLSCELEYALGDAQTRGSEFDAQVIESLMGALDDPALEPEDFGRRHEDLVFTRLYEPSSKDMPAFTEELNQGWAKVAGSTDGVESLYVRRDEFEAGRDAQAVRLVTAPGVALLGMPMLSRFGTATHVSMDDLMENGLTPVVQDIVAPVPGQGEQLAATVASLSKAMHLEPTPEAAQVLPSCLREVIELKFSSSSPVVARPHRGPSAGM